MQNTMNYNLNKPDGNDFAKIQALNENADIIDGKLKNLEDGLNNIDFSSINQAIANVDSRVNTHSANMAQHNQFMDGTTKKQLVFGVNQTLNCLTVDIVEVTT